MLISVSNICNLSRIPISIEKNPLYLTSLQILENKNINFKNTYLFEFYKNFKPQTLRDLYNIRNNKFDIFDLSYKTGFLPWLHESSHKCFSDVAFIKFNVEEKVSKLKKLVSSFLTHGYKPESFPTRQGEVCGHFLEHKNKKKFYIIAGNHRAAVYAAVFKNKKLPVIFEDKSFMKEKELKFRACTRKIYSSKDIEEWPSVKSKQVSKDCALQFIEKYFNI